MNLNYTTGIPDTPNDPSNDQPPMKINTNSINSIIQIDHHGFNDNLGGYHTIIHQNAQVTDPANIVGPPQINQVYPKSYTPDTTGGVADTQLFTRTALGAISQLTGFLKSAANEADGWQWIGGILVQWGKKSLLNVTHESNAVTFKDRVTGAIPFPNFIYMVNATLIPVSSSTTTIATISIGAVSKTSFGYVVNQSSGGSGYNNFYWIAIGS